jgi:hypothetical protein
MSFLVPIALLYLGCATQSSSRSSSRSRSTAGSTRSSSRLNSSPRVTGALTPATAVYEDAATDAFDLVDGSTAPLLAINTDLADVVGAGSNANKTTALLQMPPAGWGRVQWRLDAAQITWRQIASTGIWGGFLFLVPNYCW